MSRTIPTDRPVTYQQQYRTCGKNNCGTCAGGRGHGPYWYAYWRENGVQMSAYVGKTAPSSVQARQADSESPARSESITSIARQDEENRAERRLDDESP